MRFICLVVALSVAGCGFRSERPRPVPPIVIIEEPPEAPVILRRR